MDFELLCPCCNARLKIDPDLKAVIAELSRDKLWEKPIVTEVAGNAPFFDGEVEPWRSDGTAAGTTLVANVSPIRNSAWPTTPSTVSASGTASCATQ